MRFILALILMALPVHADTVAKIGVDWVGNDIVIESFQDPKVAGVTCHIAYFSRSVLDRLSQGNWFEDPSNNAIQCAQTGPIDVSDLKPGKSEKVFSEGRSLIFKSLNVSRIYDDKAQVLIYLAHANELTQGSAKMSMSTVPLYQP